MSRPGHQFPTPGKHGTSGSNSPADQASGQPSGRRKGQKGTEQGSKSKGPQGVEQGTEMSPGKGKGYAHPHGSTRAEDEYLYKRYEHYGSEYSEDDEDIYAERAQFVAIDHDFTPK